MVAKNNNNVQAALSYLLWFITGIIFLLVSKDKFVRFHAMQSTITFGGLWILSIILGYIPFLSFLSSLLWLFEVVLWIVLLVKAYQGQYFKLPYVGDLAEQQVGKLK